jgi:hypothetical protein
VDVLRVAALVTGLVYLGWRLAFTFGGAHPVMFVLLVAAEAFGMMRLWIEVSLIGIVRPVEREPERFTEPDADVVVIVTDEPASEVRAAVLSARLARGCGKLLIADRDGRPDVAELAQRLEIERVTGSLDGDLGKLIDTALVRCPSLYTLLVPANLVVLPDVLEVTSGAFDDTEVGVVLCRIEDTNANHEVDFGGYGEHHFRDTLLLGKLHNSGFLPWWSDMAVVRQTAIADIGGMTHTGLSVTMSAGIRLQAAGWRITDVPVVVARRLAPWSDDVHLHRWSRDLYERLAVLVDPNAPHKNEHSTRLSRRVYRIAGGQVGRSIQRIVLFGILFTTMFTSSLPLVADPVVLIGLWGAWMGSSLVMRYVATRSIGFTPWIVNDLRLLTTNVTVAWKVLSRRPLQSQLMDPAPGRQARRIFLTLLQTGLTGSLVVFSTGVLRPAHGDFVTLTTFGMSIWLLLMIAESGSGLKLRQVRQSFRTSEELEVFASKSCTAVINVSQFGIGVVSSVLLEVGARIRVAFGLPQADGESSRIEVSTKVKRSTHEGDRHVAYLGFALLTDDQMDRIIEYCSGVAGMRMLRDNLGVALEETTVADVVHE